MSIIFFLNQFFFTEERIQNFSQGDKKKNVCTSGNERKKVNKRKGFLDKGYIEMLRVLQFFFFLLNNSNETIQCSSILKTSIKNRKHTTKAYME